MTEDRLVFFFDFLKRSQSSVFCDHFEVFFCNFARFFLIRDQFVVFVENIDLRSVTIDDLVND